MNLFLFWTNEAGEKELVTPPLDGTILPGVTRDSILTLTRDWKEFKVSERPVTMAEAAKAISEGRMLEMFGAGQFLVFVVFYFFTGVEEYGNTITGTAAIVSPIKKIFYKGKDLVIPLDPSKPESQAGPLTKRLADTIMGIQYGEIQYKDRSVVVD